MSNPDQVDGSTVLFKATPIHEGPLNKYHGDPQNNFRSATYNVAKTDKEITLYRLYGGNIAKEDGSWWTPVKPEAYGKNALDSRIDYAVLESWKNTMENCAEIRVPADTLMFTGCAGEQISKYNEYKSLFYKHGGKCQVFLPREIVKGLVEYNKTGNTSTLYSNQKEFIKNWEQRNFKITNFDGKTLHTNPAQFEKLQNCAKSLNVPDLSKTNANTFKQAAIPQRLNTIIYQPPTNEIREIRKFTQQSVKTDAILGDLIFGTNLFQAAVEENTKIELTKSDVSTYKNPCILELELFKRKDRKSLEAQKDACNFGCIGPHPKFVINKNAKLYIKDDKLICDGCPMDICIRGVYQDFYGNTYYDDTGKRCHKNHSFVSDFRKNFWNYFEIYPVLKKVATYTIFIAATLNCKSLNYEKTDFQTISKTPRKRTSNNESEEIEIKILEAKEDLFRQKPSNPLAWNLLGNEWCKYDVIKARSIIGNSLFRNFNECKKED